MSAFVESKGLGGVFFVVGLSEGSCMNAPELDAELRSSQSPKKNVKPIEAIKQALSCLGVLLASSNSVVRVCQNLNADKNPEKLS